MIVYYCPRVIIEFCVHDPFVRTQKSQKQASLWQITKSLEYGECGGQILILVLYPLVFIIEAFKVNCK